jgi:hypothetical protein
MLMIMARLCHFYDLGAIHNTLQAFGVDHAILLAGQQFIPPAKEEIAGDELKPRRERVAYNPAISIIRQSTGISALHTLIFEHCLQLGLVNVFVVANLIHVPVHRHVGGQEEDVIN